MNCAETIQDRPGQPAYEMFAINSLGSLVSQEVIWCHWMKRFPSNEGIKEGYPLQNVRFLLLSTNLARERLEIDTDLLRIITSTADELSEVPTSMTLNDLEPEK